MAAIRRPETGLGAPGAWAQRRIAFHATSTYASSPAMEPLNEPLARNGGAAAEGGNLKAGLIGKATSQSLPSSMPLQWPAPQKIGAGLSNLGNTCFLNSVLQCLTYTPPLAGYLQSGQHKVSCRVAGFCALCALQEHVLQALTSSGRVVSPSKLAKNLRSISRSFRMCRQEDAHEYMRYLLEALHKCCIPPELASNSNSKPSQDKSLVYKIFGGRLRSQVKCTVCSHCSNTYDPFLDLSLDIVRADSLTKALTRFTSVEVLDGDNKYRCTHCKKKVRALKQFTIETVPNILTIQFKRFSSSGSHGGKIDKKVDFGTTLDLKPFSSSGQESAPRYKLYGVLVHSGWSTHSGHYYCFVRTSSDIWHVLDDSRVRQVSERTVLEQKAYMLFYVREGSGGQVMQKLPSLQAVKSITDDSGRVAGPLNGQNGSHSTKIIESMDSNGHQTAAATIHSAISNSIVKVPSPPAAVPSSSVPVTSAATVEALPCASECPTSAKETKEKDLEVENSCTTSGNVGVEDDWDEYYKRCFNGSGGTSQSLLRLLRAMPRTRRYFMARAVPTQRTSKAQHIVIGQLENGQMEVTEPPTSIVTKEAKKRHLANGESFGTKKLRKEMDEDGVVSGVVTLEKSKDEIIQVEFFPSDGSPHTDLESVVQAEISMCPPEGNGNGAASDDVVGKKFDGNGGPPMRPADENGGNGPSSSSSFHVRDAQDIRERHHPGAELRVDSNGEGNCQPTGTGYSGVGDHLHQNGSFEENGGEATHTRMHLTTKTDLYGVGVPRWNEGDGEENGFKDVDRLLQAEKGPTFEQDIWDAEYDRGRSKKVRNKAGRGVFKTESSNGTGNIRLKSDNVFQAFGSNKLANGHGVKAGKNVG